MTGAQSSGSPKACDGHGFRKLKVSRAGCQNDEEGDSGVLEIRCPSCDTAYAVPADRVGPNGRKVRCARCGTSWLAIADATAEAADFLPEPVAIPPSVEPSFADMTAVDGEAPLEADDAATPDWREVSTQVAVAQALTAPLAGVARRRTVIDAAPAGFQTEKKRPAQASAPPRRVPTAPARRSASVADRWGPWALGCAVALVGAAVLFRAPIVSAIPDLARLYASIGLPVNLRGLEVRTVTATRDIENGGAVMIVQGEIANTGGKEAALPPVRIALRSGGHEVYAWLVDPSRATLAAGASLPFRARLASPPANAEDVLVRFGERRQAAAERH